MSESSVLNSDAGTQAEAPDETEIKDKDDDLSTVSIVFISSDDDACVSVISISSDENLEDGTSSEKPLAESCSLDGSNASSMLLYENRDGDDNDGDGVDDDGDSNDDDGDSDDDDGDDAGGDCDDDEYDGETGSSISESTENRNCPQNEIDQDNEITLSPGSGSRKPQIVTRTRSQIRASTAIKTPISIINTRSQSRRKSTNYGSSGNDNEEDDDDGCNERVPSSSSLDLFVSTKFVNGVRSMMPSSFFLTAPPPSTKNMPSSSRQQPPSSIPCTFFVDLYLASGPLAATFRLDELLWTRCAPLAGAAWHRPNQEEARIFFKLCKRFFFMSESGSALEGNDRKNLSEMAKVSVGALRYRDWVDMNTSALLLRMVQTQNAKGDEHVLQEETEECKGVVCGNGTLISVATFSLSVVGKRNFCDLRLLRTDQRFRGRGYGTAVVALIKELTRNNPLRSDEQCKRSFIWGSVPFASAMFFLHDRRGFDDGWDVLDKAVSNELAPLVLPDSAKVSSRQESCFFFF